MRPNPYETRILLQKDFPETLKNIHKPPASLHIAGHLPPPHYKYLCVVGSRTFSSYGKEVCRKLVSGLSGYPICIVSGMAVGIDSMAHEAALEAGLHTIAFPGSGLNWDVLYPASKRGLAHDILKAGGALLSKFRPEQTGGDWTFPVRNELMAAISHAVLIIEAGRGSGTLITAKYAEDFNRDIFTVPGRIDAELSYGPHMLIRRGAAVITCSEDILQEFNMIERVERSLVEKKTAKKKPGEYDGSKFNLDIHNLTPTEKSVCSFLKIEQLSATELMEKASLSSAQLNIVLSELEMKNVLKEENGRYMIKTK